MTLKKIKLLHFRIEGSEKCGHLELLHSPSVVSQHSGPCWSLATAIHLTLNAIQKVPHPPGLTSIIFPATSPIAEFILSLFSRLNEYAEPSILTRFIFSSHNGYISRSDIVQQRLECSQYVFQAASFLRPLQQVNGVEHTLALLDLETLFHKAVGAVVIKPGVTSEDVDLDLRKRLNLSFVHSEPIAPRRLAWVQGREDIDCIERAFKAAAALGISLVILDEPGHWLQDPNSPWAYLREFFIELDISPDEELAIRVAHAVRAYPHEIDGIVTISDVRLAAIAEACQMLGLPTESPEAYMIAGDKGRTRLLERVGADESSVLQSADELDSYITHRNQSLRFPLVVKPVVGWCSDCVSKVHSTSELVLAVQKASDRHAQAAKPSTAVVVEPYVDGPEVDANFVILDGEILFLDINDDFPSTADEQRAGLGANFQETQNVIPSGLPKSERDAIKEQLRDSILREGFKSGIFHCEARVRNSSVRYEKSQFSGLVDLQLKGEGDKQATIPGPEIYLHEINARPPGYLESVAVLLAYGIDYYALRMLLALGPSETARLRALSQPFLKGPQFHLSLMIIQQTRAGVMKTADASKEFLEKHPHVREWVVDYYTRKKGGDILEGPDASQLWWIAYFSVISRTSRAGLLERVDYIQRHFEYEVEG